MECHWQTLMYCFDPIAFTVGSFQIHWYALCFLLAWWIATRVALWYDHSQARTLLTNEQWWSLSWWILLGAFLGARLGFALFYMPGYFLEHISILFFPYDFTTSTWTPFGGMSFHGGVFGVGVVLLWWAHRYGGSLWQYTDRLAVVAPLVSFIGRLGNFLNHELPGRITESSLGVYFPFETALRHPVTLYGMLGEGILLFAWMFFWAKRFKRDGMLTVLYLFSYAVIRFGLEYFREPDPGVTLLLGIFSRGQVLSVAFLFLSFFGWFWLQKRAQWNNFKQE